MRYKAVGGGIRSDDGNYTQLSQQREQSAAARKLRGVLEL
jgi:hypothetical protein